jgi:hypothetical protein
VAVSIAVAKIWLALIAAASIGAALISRLAVPAPVCADVVGVASVIDTDTIEIHGGPRLVRARR